MTVLAFAALSQAVLTQKASAAPGYFVASLNSGIDAGAQDFVVTSINDARASGATTFVLILNTFGGNGNNMDNIIQAISAYQTGGNTFITLVAPRNAHAFSAGAFIAEASTKIFMVDGTVIGSATPVLPPLSDETTLRKDIAAFAQYMNSTTSSNHRNGNAALLMVTDGTAYSASQAVTLRVSDGPLLNASLSMRQALAALPAPYAVPEAETVQIHEPGIRAVAISVLSDPNVDSILFLLGVFAILADLYHPTVILTIVGATALALALVGLGVFGASLVSILLMLMGAFFVFLEIKTHHGLSALIGVIVFIIGFVLIFRLPPPPPEPSQPTGLLEPVPPLTYAIIGLIGAVGVLGSVYLYRVREALMKKPPHVDPKLVVGREGYLTSDLKAGGLATANVGSEDYTVTATQDIPKGARVVVRDIQGLKLVVEKKEG